MKQRTYLHYFYSPSRTARETFFYVESIGHYQCDKSFFEDSYYKKNFYLIYVVSGKGYMQSGDEKIIISPGQLIYINLSEPYKYYSHKKDPWEILWIFFGGKDAEWFYNNITGRSKTILNISEDSGIPKKMNEIFELYGTKDPFIEFKTHRLLTDLLVDLYIESVRSSNIKKDKAYELPDPVKAVMDFVEQNYFRRITLEELAAITYLNPFYLLKLFKKHTGYTPGEYINRFRIEYSKQLLAKPEMTIEQIALFLGFNTHSYFSKIFRQSTGLTPVQFRKMYLH